MQEQKEQDDEPGEQPGDALQPDVPQPDTPQPDAPQPDAPQPDAPQPDTLQPDAPEQQDAYTQRLALLSSSLDALKREDSEAIDRMAAEASAKDCTGWFKWTRWDEHL